MCFPPNLDEEFNSNLDILEAALELMHEEEDVEDQNIAVSSYFILLLHGILDW